MSSSHKTTNGKENWVRKLLSTTRRESCLTTRRRNCSTSNQPNQLQIQFVTDQGDLITSKMEETRPVPTRSMSILFAKNSVLQTERCDLLLLFIRLKCRTALEHVLLMKATRSTLMVKYFAKEWKIPLLIMTRVMNQWWWTKQTWTSESDDHHFPLWNTRTIPAFDNWFRKLRTIQINMLFNKIYDRIINLSFQSRIKTNDSGCWEHRIMWITRDGTQNAVHNLFIMLEHWDTLLYMRAFFAQRRRDESAVHQLYDGPSFSSGVRHQETTTSWTSIWLKVGRQGTLYGWPVEEKIQEKVFPRSSWPMHTRSRIPQSND